MLLFKTALVSIGLALIALSISPSEENINDPKDNDASDKTRAAVDTWLAALTKDKPSAVPPTVAAVDGGVRSAFPDDRFYTIRFMRYPRAVTPPAPLKLENLVRVRPDLTVDRIESLDGLKKLFDKKLSDTQNEAQIRTTVLAGIRLAQEFYQDGYYVFTVNDESVTVDRRDKHLVGSGKAVVTKGGKGQVTVTLTTGTPGVIVFEGNVRPDIRLR